MIPVAIALALAAAALHGTWNVLVKVSGDPISTLQRATVAGAVLIAVLAVRRARLMAVEDPAPVGAPSISKALKLN